METYNLTDPPAETLGKLAAAGHWQEWRGALALFAGIGLAEAAQRAGGTAGDFHFSTAHAAHLDLIGLRTDCGRTATWLATWLGRTIRDLAKDGDNNSMAPYVQIERLGNSDRVTYVAVYREYKIGD